MPTRARRHLTLLAIIALLLTAPGAAAAPSPATPSEILALAEADPALAGLLSSGVTVTAIATSSNHTCALTAAGGVKCWGYNTHGQLGDGTNTHRHTPVDVQGLTTGVTGIAGGSNHTCALTTAGGVKCWGYNNQGQLGDGTNTNRNAPADVQGLSSGVSAVATGVHHSCAITSAGGVKCWGNNFYGGLGDGTNTNSLTPVDVLGLASGVTVIAAGEYHSCALTAATGVKCWGLNEYGELGDGSTTNRNAPVDVHDLTSGVSTIAAGAVHSCAVTAAGGVQCWGWNGYGQLGDGSTTDRFTPVDVQDLASGVSRVAAQLYHTCALTVSGGAKCWGYNNHGQLGDDTITSRNTPTDVIGLASGVARIAAGWEHTCALTDAGGVKCWGDNSYGQLGDDTTTDRYTPVDVVGLEGIQDHRVFLPVVIR